MAQLRRRRQHHSHDVPTDAREMTSGPRGQKGKRVLRLDRGAVEVHSALDEEIALHLALRIEQLMARGMSPDEARACVALSGNQLKRAAGQ